ncbi:MAG: site-2 protease family protein [bacterium]
MKLDPIILLQFVALLFSITIHEASHAWMAKKCGDPTAAYLGRITLNPVPHIDLIGTIIIPLFLMIFSPGFGLIGWGKPCPVNPLNYRNYKRDDILVSIAGVTSNFIAALASLLLLKSFLTLGFNSKGMFVLFQIMFQLNIVLMIFNLLPIPPLDGSHLLKQLLSQDTAEKLAFLDQWGFLILLILINTPVFDSFFFLFMNPFNRLFWLIVNI